MEKQTIRIEEEQCSIGISSILGTRNSQQDTVYASQKNGEILAVVCDGMGGMQCGDKASQAAVERLVQDFVTKTKEDYQDFLKNEIKVIDKEVAGILTEEGALAEAGTTLAAAVISNGFVYWVSVGDSRIYFIRGDEYRVITRDHNYKLLLDEKLESGEISLEEYARESAQAEALISFLGMGNVSLIDTGRMRLNDRDQVLLCSDGLYRSLQDDQIAQIVAAGIGNPEKTADFLTACAFDEGQGAQDNTSVILIEYREEEL